jgi:hypothetical protein
MESCAPSASHSTLTRWMGIPEEHRRARGAQLRRF